MTRIEVNRALFVILLIGRVFQGESLNCYVCTSLENSDCTSSPSTVSSTSCASSIVESTTYSESLITATSDDDIIATSSSTTLTDFSTTERTTTTSESSTASSFEAVTSDITSITDETTISGDDSTSTGTEESVVNVRRVVRNTEQEFSCYTIILTIDGTTVTDRGCATTTTATCEDLMEEKYPGYNETNCETCTEDGCNSSAINFSGIVSITLPLLVVYLIT